MLRFARSRMNVLACFALAVMALTTFAAVKSANAAELIMVHSPICEWCDTWEDEIGVVYNRTAQGGRAPLRRVDIDDVEKSAFRIDRPVIYTPTFLLIDGGREIGRIDGYPGENYFWVFLDELLNKAPNRGCPQGAPKAAQSHENIGKRPC